MKMITKMLVFSALSLATITGFAAAASSSSNNSSSSDTVDITGNYQCKGFDPGGNTNYSNPITVVKNGDTYTFQWLNSSGYPFNLGTGIFNTEMKDVVSVVFWDPKKSDFFGTMLYEIKPDGTLQGNWVIQATKQIGTETCTKSK